MSFSLFHRWVVLVTIALFTCSSFSSENSLTPDEIKAIKDLQVSAKKVNQELDRRLSCYNDLDSSLQEKSETLQRDAGKLHKKEKELSDVLKKKKSETEGYEREYNNAKTKAQKTQVEINEIYRSIAMYQAALNSCRKNSWPFGFLCDFSAEILGFNDKLRKNQNSLKALRETQRHSKKQLDNAKNRQAEAKTSYLRILQRVKNNNTEIQKTENRIATLKKTLEKMRIQSQTYAKTINTFNNLLVELDKQDINTERRYYQRKIRRAADDLHQKMDTTTTLLELESAETKACAQKATPKG
ncbi:hypothetical protein [Gilvimarinus xylanilyticus]|uniref:Chromosome partition protein Smc n=1 Tax=Gilvimarinus xylanilyticus TaxID=2944139 RepID=A0A9X2I0N2_9GAMM|nr:hypothetical protein [Gilvimarinus xylanilyticus]MCP8898463.1 hypothetical protein [Gilvimarinus xylanilyticus]